jgi:hypothetical protein
MANENMWHQNGGVSKSQQRRRRKCGVMAACISESWHRRENVGEKIEMKENIMKMKTKMKANESINKLKIAK